MKYVATVIAKGDTLNQQVISQIQTDLTKHFEIKDVSIKSIDNKASDIFFSIEYSSVNVKDTFQKAHIFDQYNNQDINLIIQPDNEHRFKKLVVFDMDSTLIYQEVIELIASYAGVEPQVKAITDLAMNNEIDFKESLSKRVGLLKGLKIDTLYAVIKKQLKITNGVAELSQLLREKNVKLAVVSGGFIQFAEYVKNELKFDFALANELEMDGKTGELTGNLINKDSIVDGECKAKTIKQLCDEYKIDIQDSLMIGDGGNDLLGMKTAGFGIAWNAKPTVQIQAPSRLNSSSMYDVRYILGL
ncbi:hypothetical protein TBLA_0B07560 [Henningerozyma blattae CBS 6284]|uniref:phosphoserine phosphatase n=1 Tax=Henningerozyma blattae (strain ATCC 34711 / CBS 6284 / DSM 70876 / NBRC 10599 / NRRL Y-10934 / UCD 77-7) TaxID=1071380 RepID=I2GZM1_HENB6|nr:hypothetical protein TBLA_0B07560 [Tetrapisispora blattae CBS 6284]CCH59573.1 hypothetical protein TBLA_0B07560 [Tetrapisispora blattae CBS 6284]